VTTAWLVTTYQRAHLRSTGLEPSMEMTEIFLDVDQVCAVS